VLDEMITGTELHGLDCDGLITMTCHHNRGRERAAGGQGLQDLQPPSAGHVIIDEEHIISPCRCENQPSGSIAHHLHRVSGSYESALGELSLPSIVFHKQNVD